MLLAQGQVNKNPERQITSHKRPYAQVQKYHTAFKASYPAEHTFFSRFCFLCREMPQPSACKLLIQHSAEQEESRKDCSLRNCQ